VISGTVQRPNNKHSNLYRCGGAQAQEQEQEQERDRCRDAWAAL
jgi:hypothetical protein